MAAKQCFSLEGAQARMTSNIAEYRHMCEHGESLLVPLETGMIQCVACHRFGEKKNVPLSTSRGMPISKWTRLQSFKDHADSQRHQLAMVEWLGEKSIIPATSMASPARDFEMLLQDFRQEAVRKEYLFGKRKKIRKMIWCLAEAIRQTKKSVLRSSSQLAVHQDGAAGYLFARFTSSDVNGQRCSGYLGGADLAYLFKSANATAIARGIIKILKSSCSANVGCPAKAKLKPKFDAETYDHVRKSLSLLDAVRLLTKNELCASSTNHHLN
jgi:hypothetical protein